MSLRLRYLLAGPLEAATARPNRFQSHCQRGRYLHSLLHRTRWRQLQCFDGTRTMT
tara:strand:+ start:408 stop:575 length:168 start_codon:yes stop_codon:yes gene_type:complete